jgi:hypothetical protein
MDPSRRVAIGYSSTRMAGLIVLGAGMTGMSLTIYGWRHPLRYDLFFVVGIVGALFFGLGTAVMLWRALTTGAVVTLAPEGLRDVRVAREFIPWTAIERVSTYTISGQSFVIVAVAPEVEQRLTLTAIARWTRGANRAIGADGLAVGPQGLAIDCAALQAAIEARVEAARSGAGSSGV